MAQVLRSLMPPTCRFLNPGDVKLIGDHPVAAGGFADIWKAMYEGQEVAFKRYRCYEMFDVAQVAERSYNEVRAWSLLHHRGVKVPKFVGVCPTETHPFCLVYEYMDSLDLKQHLKNEPDAGSRLKLLVNIAQDLNRMHNLGIVHGSLQSENVLVDKSGTPYIAGLGNVRILPHAAALEAEDGTDSDQLFCNRVGLAGPRLSPNGTDTTQPTKTGDMYFFGILAFEILTGRPPFSEMAKISATQSMLEGCRPPRPSHHGVSDRLWYMIERCWHTTPSQRMPIGEVVELLGTTL